VTDRRRLKSNGRVACSSLQGKVEAERFVEGSLYEVTAPSAVIWSAPGGAQDRELVFGETFCVLKNEGGFAFGYALRDEYVGYVAAAELAPFAGAASHVVNARLTQGLATPDFKVVEGRVPFTLGARLRVTGWQGKWAQIESGGRSLFLPACHMRPADAPEVDSVAVAERLWGVPYVWGGNTSLGIDCSGLVQAGCLACGIACPGDSDMQAAELGVDLPKDADVKRGDLLFWKGHVAWVVDAETILHANAYHMAVAYEPLDEAIARIERQGDGPLTARKRLEDVL